MSELNAEQLRHTIVVLPDVTITASYQDLSGRPSTENFVIHSIIQMLWGAQWLRDGRPDATDTKTIYIAGAHGTLSYQDQENPGEGFYNIYKQSGYF